MSSISPAVLSAYMKFSRSLAETNAYKTEFELLLFGANTGAAAAPKKKVEKTSHRGSDVKVLRELDDDERSLHSDKTKEFKCTFCDMTFTSFHDRKMHNKTPEHLKIYHKARKVPTVDPEKRNGKPWCPVCESDLNSDVQFREHTNSTHHKAEIKELINRSHLQTLANGEFKCDLCDIPLDIDNVISHVLGAGHRKKVDRIENPKLLPDGFVVKAASPPAPVSNGMGSSLDAALAASVAQPSPFPAVSAPILSPPIPSVPSAVSGPIPSTAPFPVDNVAQQMAAQFAATQAAAAAAVPNPFTTPFPPVGSA
jgi:hypothetical protein